MTEDFEPDQYHDSYREALEAVVQAKVEGNDVVRPAGFAAPEPKKEPADLAEILRASVAALKEQRSQSNGATKPAARAKDAKPASRPKSAPRPKAAPRTKATKDDDKDDEAKTPRTRARKASA
jgi:DNA end-binding protein Ku